MAMVLAAALRTQRVLWGALLMATLMYGFLIFSGIFRPPPQPPDQAMLFALAGVACVVAVMSFVLPGMIYKQAVSAVKLDVIDEPAPAGFAAAFQRAGSGAKVFADPEAALRRAAALSQTRLILSVALSEAVALFGFMLAVLGFDKLVAIPFLAVGAVLVVIRFPTEEQIVKPFEAALGATLQRGGSTSDQ